MKRESIVGKTNVMKNGMKAIVIEDRGANDIDIQFEDGVVVKTTRYKFRKGTTMHPRASLVGERNKMNCGMNATVIADRGINDLDIVFEDGVVVYHKAKKEFYSGHIGHPNLMFNKEAFVGSQKRMNNGMNATVIAYRNCKDIDIVFEDGTLVEHTRKELFDNGYIRNPSLKRTRTINIKDKHAYIVKINKNKTKLSEACPELTKEWHYKKNGILNPSEVSCKSNIKVWWQCKNCGYEWNAAISSRSSGRGCPVCAGRTVWEGHNDLKTKNPQLAEEWNYDKNDELRPEQFVAGSNKKVWWKCKTCGYEWNAVICSRSKGIGCPACAGKAAHAGVNDLQTQNPQLAKEWNFEKNGELLPSQFTTGSDKKVWWKCKTCGYEWYAAISSRSKGVGCPACVGQAVYAGFNDLQTLNPQLADEWNYEKNVGLLPSQFTAGTHKKVWWKCRTCNYEWKSEIKSRSAGSGCPKCGRLIVGEKKSTAKEEDSLYSLRPELMEEWSDENSIDPKKVKIMSGKSAQWKCRRCGYEWLAKIRDRSRGVGCPVCAGKVALKGYNDLQTINPELSAEWNYEKNGELVPTEITKGCIKNVWWICKVCGHEWKSTVNNRITGNGCPKCFHRNKTSFPEQAIFYYVKKSFPDSSNGYKDIFVNSQMEIDIYIPSKHIGIEYDGVAWHKTKATYERENKKYNILKENNISLIRVKENKKDIQSKDCDYLIIVETSLEKAIKEVFKILDVDVDINVERDEISIKELYYTTIREESLALNYPELAKEWHPARNGSLTPDMFYKASGEKVWWKGKCGHEWQAVIGNRIKGVGCPYCSNKKVLKGFNDLATLSPQLSSEWHPTKNGDLSPEMITRGSGKKVWWKGKCGHEWQALISNRDKGQGCPFCSGRRVLSGVNDLETLRPDIARYWNAAKNGLLTPSSVTCGSNKTVWWKCYKCGYEWQSMIAHMTNLKKNCCPNCR